MDIKKKVSTKTRTECISYYEKAPDAFFMIFNKVKKKEKCVEHKTLKSFFFPILYRGK